jgi:predicted dehydrogenase
MGISVGFIGCGSFANSFIPLFKLHPLVDKVVLCEKKPDRLAEVAQKHGVSETYTSMDEMFLRSDIDSVAVFVPRHLHGPVVLQSLRAGKNVYCAVPTGNSVEEIHEIVETVKSTRQIYMMGETCIYFPCSMFCRKMHREGRFGTYVYGEAQYYHDITEFFPYYKREEGENWQRVAGLPPYFYPTHSTAMLLHAIDDYATKVSAMGYRDHRFPDIYGEGKNDWDNPFSNETMLIRLSRGGVGRINEFRCVGTRRPSSYITAMYGDKGAYEMASRHHVFQEIHDDGPTTLQDVSAEINSTLFEEERGLPDYYQRSLNAKYDSGFSAIHNVARLPKEFADFRGFQHNGSHQFLVDDFVKAVDTHKLPPNHIWDAARYMLPGLIGHESALRDGELMDVPDFGDPPADWELLDPDSEG